MHGSLLLHCERSFSLIAERGARDRSGSRRSLEQRRGAVSISVTKARQIAHAWFAFAQIRWDYFSYLGSFPSELRARDAVVETFPGLGLKQTSMLLRDIGYSKSLAIIESHIIWYLNEVHAAEI